MQWVIFSSVFSQLVIHILAYTIYRREHLFWYFKLYLSYAFWSLSPNRFWFRKKPLFHSLNHLAIGNESYLIGRKYCFCALLIKLYYVKMFQLNYSFGERWDKYNGDQIKPSPYFLSQTEWCCVFWLLHYIDEFILVICLKMNNHLSRNFEWLCWNSRRKDKIKHITYSTIRQFINWLYYRKINNFNKKCWIKYTA